MTNKKFERKIAKLMSKIVKVYKKYNRNSGHLTLYYKNGSITFNEETLADENENQIANLPVREEV